MSRYCGIDIAAATFDMVVRTQGKAGSVQRFAQTAQGHAKAVKKLKSLQPERIVLEATGVYYLDLALALQEAGLPVSVINPRSFKHFAAMKLADSKTDPQDAALLAEYAERITPPVWVPPPAHCVELRDIGRQINRLIHSRTQAKNRLHALTAKRGTSALLIEDEKDGIAWLDRRIQRLQQAALAISSQAHSPSSGPI